MSPISKHHTKLDEHHHFSYLEISQNIRLRKRTTIKYASNDQYQISFTIRRLSNHETNIKLTRKIFFNKQVLEHELSLIILEDILELRRIFSEQWE